MGMFDWLWGKDPIQAAGESAETRPGKAAYELARAIVDTEDKPRWKELMDLYYTTSKPKAKVEVLKIAAALAKKFGVEVWQRDVQAKEKQLQDHGYL